MTNYFIVSRKKRQRNWIELLLVWSQFSVFVVSSFLDFFFSYNCNYSMTVSSVFLMWPMIHDKMYQVSRCQLKFTTLVPSYFFMFSEGFQFSRLLVVCSGKVFHFLFLGNFCCCFFIHDLFISTKRKWFSPRIPKKYGNRKPKHRKLNVQCCDFDFSITLSTIKSASRTEHVKKNYIHKYKVQQTHYHRQPMCATSDVSISSFWITIRKTELDSMLRSNIDLTLHFTSYKKPNKRSIISCVNDTKRHLVFCRICFGFSSCGW